MLFNNFHQLGRLTTTNTDGWTNPENFQTRISDRVEELKLQVAAGDRVLICHGGSAGFVVDLFACWSLGAAAACINPTTTENEKRNLVEFIKPAAIIESAENPALSTQFSGQSTMSQLSLDLPALYLFTSGTTGTPKGVEHTFRSILSRITLNQTFIGLDNLRTTLCPLPTHFGHGLIGNLLTPLLGGCDVVLLDDKSPMGLSRLGAIIDEYDITFMSSVPSFWKLASRLSKQPIKNSLKRVHVGSAPLSADLWRAIAKWARTDDVFNM